MVVTNFIVVQEISEAQCWKTGRVTYNRLLFWADAENVAKLAQLLLHAKVWLGTRKRWRGK